MILKTNGFDDLQKMLDDIGTLEKGNIAEKMLDAGKADVRKVWRDVIGEKDYVRLGLMEDKVNATKVKENNFGHFCSIYPFGEEKDRVRRGKTVTMRNAAKAYLLHYGWDGNWPSQIAANHGVPPHFKGSRFVDKIEKIGSEMAHKTMNEIFSQYLQSKG